MQSREYELECIMIDGFPLLQYLRLHCGYFIKLCTSRDEDGQTLKCNVSQRYT